MDDRRRQILMDDFSGSVKLWAAVIEQLFRDLVNGEGRPHGTDWKRDAQERLRDGTVKTICQFLGLEPEYLLKQFARVREDYDGSKKQRRMVSREEEGDRG
jgi:hypothetical protein